MHGVEWTYGLTSGGVGGAEMWLPVRSWDMGGLACTLYACGDDDILESPGDGL
jgi:hypothetical protein